jgi:hypothetical protein
MAAFFAYGQRRRHASANPCGNAFFSEVSRTRLRVLQSQDPALAIDFDRKDPDPDAWRVRAQKYRFSLLLTTDLLARDRNLQ